MVAGALLSGMEVVQHSTQSRRWCGASYTIYSTEIGATTIYRLSKASLARVYLAARLRKASEVSKASA